MKHFFKLFLPQQYTVSFAEKLRSGLAGGFAILWLGLLIEFMPHDVFPLLMLGSIAASVALLFALPHSPMAQPWNLVVGHLVSALTGWYISALVGDVVIAAALAVGLAIWFMHLLDAMHPPGAATALSLVLGSFEYHFLGGAWMSFIVCVNVGAALLFALVINNLLPGRRYPAPHPSSVATSSYIPLGAITAEDVSKALSSMDSVIDVSEDDLLQLSRLVVQHAYQREAEQ
jgi:CBS domain-containing membrane protein